MRFEERVYDPGANTPGTIHLGMRYAFGIGDTLMSTAAIAAVHAQEPNAPIVVHHNNVACASILDFNPAISEIWVYGTDEVIEDSVIFRHMHHGNGTEGTVLYHHVAIGARPESSRRMHYYRQPAEHRAACKLLREYGYIDGWLVGVQLHGGWRSKQWAHTEGLIKLLLDVGATVVTFGYDEWRMPEMFTHARLLNWRNTTIRLAVAGIAVLDCFQGFDSGLSFAAGAVDTPIVAIYGPHDPARLIGDVNINNLVTIRTRSPQMCYNEFGLSCRHGGSGEHCPLRDTGGGLCLDEINPAQVLVELWDMPRLSTKIEERG